MSTWFERAEQFRDPKMARRVAHFVAALSRFPTGTLVDLGAGHGNFARIAADLGWQVTAVDARAERFPDDPRIQWVTADVRDFTIDHDVVACLGLWYHLTLNDQLALAAQCSPRPLILDTHVGLPAGHPPWHNLSDLVGEAGYRGRWYSERGLQSTPTSSWGNDASFWPTSDTLVRQLHEGGYDVVDQVHPRVETDRCFYVARMVGSVDEHVERYSPPEG